MSKQRTFVFDYDGTVSTAPDQLAEIASALRAQGHRIVVLTGNPSPRNDLVKELADLGFVWDDLVQYEDNDSNGIARKQYLKQLDAWCCFDNRVDRAVVFAKVAPTFYLVTAPTDDEKDDAKGAKNDAKQTAKKLKRTITLADGPLAGNELDWLGMSNMIEAFGGHKYKVDKDGKTAHHVDDA